MQRNIAFHVAYDGTDFHGWQTQPGQRTVQALLEESIRRIVRHRVDLMGSGRTDAGVHAAGQVANFRTTCPLPSDKLQHSIGSRIAEDVSIYDTRDVHADFHATHSAERKLYRYRIFNSPHRPVERFLQRYTFHFWHPLDTHKLQEAARWFVGELDFSAMTAAGGERECMIRSVFRCDVQRNSDEIQIDVEGNGFLYRQVRNMVGTLINVGRGAWSAKRVGEILASKDRSLAGPTAPAHGLCLMWVRYPQKLLNPMTIQPLASQPHYVRHEPSEELRSSNPGATQLP